ncbi:MAG: uroporphyrinogen decarboxylase family protein [Desulfopila sp.]
MDSMTKFTTAFAFEDGPLPVDFGANPVTGIHCSIVEGLREYYGLARHPIKISCPYQMLGVIESDLKEAMGIDTDGLWNPYNMFGTRRDNWREWRTSWGQTVLISGDLVIEKREGRGYYTYAKGDTSFPPSGYMPMDSFFFDATSRHGEIDEEKLDWRDNVEEFEPISDELLDDYRRAIPATDPDRWLVGNFGGTALGDVSLVSATMLANPKGIRGVEDWYASTLLYPEYLHKIFAYQADIAIENLKKIHEVVGEKVQSVYICGADFGTQMAPICSPQSYRELHMAHHRKINDWIHDNTNWKTFKHSCGAVELFIEAFIEAGFDILNPVQWTAAGMDRKELKKKYGKRIVFWGGGVDTQKTLPFGTPEEVEREVLETCNILGRNGGFVFSSIHNIQAMTPVANVVAMIRAVQKYNSGAA